VGDTQAIIAAYHVPAAAHKDMAALNVLASVLGEQPSGRLYKALVDSKKAVSANAGTYELHDPGVLLIDVSLRKEHNFADAEKTMSEVIDGVITEPPSQEEVDRAKTRQLKNIELLLNNSERVGRILSEAAAAGDWRLLFTGRDDLEKVTPVDVARVARTYLKPSNRTIGRYYPAESADRVVVPPTPDIAAMLKDYQGRAAVEEGEAFDPSPLSIESRVTRVTLPGGLKLVLLPKKTRGATVVAAMTLHFGDEKSLNGKNAAATMAGSLLMRGTQKRNRQQIQDEIDRLKARLNVGGGVTSANVTIDTIRASIVPALRLAAEILKEPVFPESELELIRQQSIARVEAGRSDPQQIAVNATNRHVAPYPPGDPRAVMTFDENLAALKAVTIGDVRNFYRQFYGASNAELAVVGDFDAAEVRKLAEELFGSWKSPSSYAVVKRDWRKLETVNRMFEAPDKENAFFTAVTTLAMDQQDPDYPAMFLANEMFGGDSKSRLWMRIREKDGLSYGVQSQFSAGQQEKFGRVLSYAIANPGNVPKVEAAFKEELAMLLKDGFKPDEVEAGKKTFLQTQQLQRSQDGALARILTTQAELGRTMQREADLEKKVSELTVEQLNTVVRKWLDPSAISYFKSGDFKKAGVTQ
jgi:zinc protease